MKIGFFDTGLGGTTIFKETIKNLKGDYIYLADNNNSPYGTKNKELVKKLTEENINKLISLGAKIIVIACNTATSACINYLREKYKDITFIGTEPAIKPALEESDGKKVLLTATTLTLHGDKLLKLLAKLNGYNNVILLDLDKLVEYADNYPEINYKEATNYLQEKFSKIDWSLCSGIVLGCTHFPIFKEQIKSIIPSNIKIYDSAVGITNHLKNTISRKYPNYNCDKTNIELVLTKEDPYFRKKFNTQITI